MSAELYGWAVNELQEIQQGPARVRVHTTTEHPDSSYGIPVWVDAEGNSYGQIIHPAPLGWTVLPDAEDVSNESRYMVDTSRPVMRHGEIVEHGEAHCTEYSSLEEATAAFQSAVKYWESQPDKPMLVTLSEYDHKWDTWDALTQAVVP